MLWQYRVARSTSARTRISFSHIFALKLSAISSFFVYRTRDYNKYQKSQIEQYTTAHE